MIFWSHRGAISPICAITRMLTLICHESFKYIWYNTNRRQIQTPFRMLQNQLSVRQTEHRRSERIKQPSSYETCLLREGNGASFRLTNRHVRMPTMYRITDPRYLVLQATIRQIPLTYCGTTQASRRQSLRSEPSA